MSIQLVSAAAAVIASNLPAAGTVPEGVVGAGGFSGLMGTLLASAEKDSAAIDLASLPGKADASASSALLQAGLARLSRQSFAELAQGKALQEAQDMPVLPSPTEVVAPDALPSFPSGDLLAQPEDEKPVAPDGEDAANPLLGVLSTPVETSQKMLSRLPLETRGQRVGTEAAGAGDIRSALALVGEKAEVLSQKSANLATNLAAETGDFADVLHENILSGAARHPLQTGVLANPTNAGGGMRRDALTTPLASPAWRQEFGEKIVWMAKNDQQLARLSLYPAHLGPLSVTLNLDADKATAVFVAATQEARQAIEDALPRLREMLAAAGVSLGQTDVGAEERQAGMFDEEGARAAPRENRDQRNKNATAGEEGTILEAHLSAEASGSLRRGAGMVDLFA
ncbi:MAG: flagellar hook-length control protein FliK [Zoogloeaceae bacterium]|jgi:flagellar hook-length control protein FliK|nr:flagellar hook-length control protein FliK [Zoogloeaceae bacterium]